MTMKKCSACGNPSRKTVRAMVLKSDSPPRMGLVCRVCAACGVLVVPMTLRMLPTRPKKVTKARALPKLLADVQLERGRGIRPEIQDTIDAARRVNQHAEDIYGPSLSYSAETNTER